MFTIYLKTIQLNHDLHDPKVMQDTLLYEEAAGSCAESRYSSRSKALRVVVEPSSERGDAGRSPVAQAVCC